MISSRLFLMNPWWTDPGKFISDPAFATLFSSSVYFENPLLDELSLEGRPFYIIRGPRQVGKTTFLRMLIRKVILEKRFEPDNILFMSCESFVSFTDIIDAIEPWLSLRRERRKLLILDEVSFVPEWQRAILHFENTGQLVDTPLFITGSNARDLKQSSEKFPGRRYGGRDLSFYPLSPFQIATLPAFKDKSAMEVLRIYEVVGGFPHALASYSKLGYVESEVYETYKNWIVGDAARYKLHEETLKHILYRIFLCCPSRITWPQLIENTPVKSHETALEYVEHLHDAFICNVIYCYDPTTGGPSFHKARKIFFVDPLIYYVAKGWKMGYFDLREEVPQMIDQPEFRGGLFESYASSLLSRTENIFFWYSTKEKKEVDIVRVRKQKLQLWDCKLSDGRSYMAMNSSERVQILTPERLMAAGESMRNHGDEPFQL